VGEIGTGVKRDGSSRWEWKGEGGAGEIGTGVKKGWEE
jgi:hypothetical protein